MKHFRFDDSLQDQIQTIAQWCDDKRTLDEILTVGHSDVHYRGSNTLPKKMNIAIDTLYSHENWHDILPDDRTLVAQVVRVAEDAVPASHFVDKTTMLAAFSETMLACASDIAQWVSKDRGDHVCRLRLTVDAGAFIGTGIGMDGNEYATTATTIVLSRRPTASIEAGRIPFSVVTMYPDITGRNEIGTLESTGRCYGWGLARAINTQDIGPKMFWQLRENAIPCLFDRRGSGSTIVYDNYDGTNIILRYNEHSQFQGQILVENENKTGFCPLKKAMHLTLEQKNEIRSYEALFHPMLMNAQQKDHNTIGEDAHMLAPITAGPIIEDGLYRNVVEVDDVL